MELNWNFQRGGEVLGKIPSVGEAWIFSGTTHSAVEKSCKSLSKSSSAAAHTPCADPHS